MIKEYGAIDRGNSHAISVITDARHNTFHHTPRVQHPRRNLIGWGFGRSKAKHIGVANGLRTEARSQRIPNHATDTRIRTTVRLNGRRSIMRLDLKSDVVVIGEANNTSVVLKHTDAPVFVSQVFSNLLGCRKDRFFEHVFKVERCLFVAIGDPPR